MLRMVNMDPDTQKFANSFEKNALRRMIAHRLSDFEIAGRNRWIKIALYKKHSGTVPKAVTKNASAVKITKNLSILLVHVRCRERCLLATITHKHL